MEPSASLLTFIATVVAAGASLSAVVLGIDQLTSGGRLRNLENVLREAQAVQDGKSRAEILVSIHRDVLSKIVARDAVPWRAFLLPLLGAVSIISIAVRGATGMATGDFMALLLPGFTTAVGGTLPIKGLVRLAHERLRIARCYRRGLTPIRAYTDILALNEGGGHAEFNWAFLASVGLSLTGLGAGLFPALRGAPSSTEATASAVLVIVGTLTLTIAAIGIRGHLSGAGLNEPRNRDGSLKPTWAHPEGRAEVGTAPKLPPRKPNA